MKYLLDKDGNVFKAQVISGIPEGFTDISKDIVIDENAKDLSSEHIEAEFIDEVPAILAHAEHWTDGENSVYNANDIPTLTDDDGNPYLDPDWTHVDAVEAVDGVPAHYRVKKTSSADQELRQAKMDELSLLRAPLLTEADVEINKLEDNGGDSSAWRTYRQALRDITETYKKVNGDWKVITDNLVVSEFVFPTKP
mgnify:CR=1 FL=1|tara:strand:+ start:299 stop:886 length:588 start_codon:yes stop_codon:yes gene_type:complete